MNRTIEKPMRPVPKREGKGWQWISEEEEVEPFLRPAEYWASTSQDQEEEETERDAEESTTKECRGEERSLRRRSAEERSEQWANWTEEEQEEKEDEIEYAGESAEESLARQPDTDELVDLVMQTRMDEVEDRMQKEGVHEWQAAATVAEDPPCAKGNGR